MNAVVRARIDERIKDEAAIVLAAMGLTVSDAFRIMLTRIAREKQLPFDPLVPNSLLNLYLQPRHSRESGNPGFCNA